MQIANGELIILHGSVLDQDVDAIINAASTRMRGGMGLDGAVHAAAGPGLMAELKEAAPDGAKTAEVVVTHGHLLPQDYVLHVAGPIWSEERAEECSNLLNAAYTNCFTAASGGLLTSVASASLSTGIYGFPIERAAPIAVAAAVKHLTENPGGSLQRIVFALLKETEYAEFSAAGKIAAK